MAIFSTLDEIIAAIKFLNNHKNDIDYHDALARTSNAISASNRSAAVRARANICQFPILTSTSISTVSYNKANDILEQLYAQYLKLRLINELEVINLDKNDNKLSILWKVHQNDNAMSNLSMEDFLNNRNSYREAVFLFEGYLDSFTNKELYEANKALLKPYSENFNDKNLNGNVLSEASNGGSTFDMETDSKYARIEELKKKRAGLEYQLNIKKNALAKLKQQDTDYNSSNTGKSASHKFSDTNRKKAEELTYDIERITNELEAVDAEIARINDILKKIAERRTVDEREQDLARRLQDREDSKKRQEKLDKEHDEDRRDSKERQKGLDREHAKDRQYLDKQREREERDQKERQKFLQNFGSVTDFDNATIRKNNSLEPSILSFTLKYHTAGGGFESAKMALAVKTISHLVQSDEICFYINETLVKQKKVFRLLQILTGEKEFSLKFLFHMDEAKRDAKASTTTVKWWRHLKDRRTASWIREWRSPGNGYVPNCTLLMSMEDIETLKIMYKHDLLKDTKKTNKLCNLLFLMHIVIIDDVNNEILIFQQDIQGWERYTFDKLQAEVATMNKMGSVGR